MFFSGLPDLGTQIRCTQNWYIAFQMDLKYPLTVYLYSVHFPFNFGCYTIQLDFAR